MAVGTVSRVINKSGSVSEKSIKAVQTAIAKLDYNPNVVAQSLRRQRTHVIGCMIPDIANPVFSALTKAVEKALQPHGYILLIASSDLNLKRELEILQLFHQRKVDGLIISVSDENDPAVRRELERLALPIVALDRDLPVDADSIKYENANAMVSTVNYLFQLGHKRIALITGNYQISPTRERIKGYRRAFEAADCPLDENLIKMGGISEQHGFKETTALLDSPVRPTAIIAGANQILIGALRAIKRAGLVIPDDISIISWDDTPVAELVSPPISVVRRDLAEWGRLVADIMVQRLGKDSEPVAPRRLVLSCNLLVRGSCSRPA